MKPGDKRTDQHVAREDLVVVDDRADDPIATIRLPDKLSGIDWRPSGWHPIEVIDGQHRLWAFEEEALSDSFELPVVAYHGLDISWQAYLFWTINIKPKRINSSLAFDLYPLLRTEEWLERAEGLGVYRETRAQELTEALWSHPESPWYLWINMLGESGLRKPMVSQAAWIRSLIATYVKSWEGRGVSIGGLYGAPLGEEERVLPWSRAEQAAFLILAGRKLVNAIVDTDYPWAQALRESTQKELLESDKDPAFYGRQTLLSTDQGVRGFLFATNHLCYVRADKLNLKEWVPDKETDGDESAADKQAVSEALENLEQQPVASFLEDIAHGLAKYDWRTSAAPGLSEDERTFKAAFRGAGGYRELRTQLFRQLAEEAGEVGKAARDVLDRVR